MKIENNFVLYILKKEKIDKTFLDISKNVIQNKFALSGFKEHKEIYIFNL